MLGLIIYFAALIFELILAIFFCVYTFFLIYSSLKGSPFVPTKQKEVNRILDEIKLTKEDFLIELGCGDARFLMAAVKKYHLKGLGIDVNPVLIFYAGIISRIKKISNISFQLKNIFKQNLSQATIIYIFLMPDLIEKLKEKLNKELKKNSLVISHGFKIQDWDFRLIKSINVKPFPTYIYKI